MSEAKGSAKPSSGGIRRSTLVAMVTLLAVALFTETFAAAATMPASDVCLTVIDNKILVALGHDFPASATITVTFVSGSVQKAVDTESDTLGRFVANTFAPSGAAGKVSVVAQSGDTTATDSDQIGVVTSPAPVASGPSEQTIPEPEPADPPVSGPATSPAPAPATSGPVAALDNAALTAVASKRIFFGHQSVGANILDGIEAVYSDAGVNTLNRSGSNTSGTSGFFADANVGQNGNPTGKVDDFAAKLRSGIGNQVDIAFFKFCYVDIYGNTDIQALFAHYQQTMTQLQTEFPNVAFVYVTNPLTVDDAAANSTREQFNDLVRSAYGNTGRLFDLAEVESNSSNALSSEYSSDGGHLNEAGSKAAAEALLKVLAGVS